MHIIVWKKPKGYSENIPTNRGSPKSYSTRLTISLKEKVMSSRILLKKVGKWVVDIAMLLKADVLVLEELNRMIYRVGDLRKNYRLKL